MNKAVIFDLDGTLIDSQTLINDFIERKIIQKKNINLTPEERIFIFGGLSTNDFFYWLKKEKNVKINFLDIIMYRFFIYQNMKKIALISGTKEMLEWMKNEGYALGIATNSPRRYANKMLRQHKIHKYFSSIVCVDDVGRPKPSPLMLQESLRRLQCSAQECYMVDDNEPGIVAANTLGISSILLSDRTVETKAKRIIGQLEDLERIL
jgi:HAD superfamily hydrolase (TIGR01509 family)